MVLWGQVEKKLEEREVNKKANRSVSLTGVPKAPNLKWAFTKLWNAYDKPLRNYVVLEKKKKNANHRTPSLSLQLNGAHNQDCVLWGLFVMCPSNCPVCTHALTMQMHVFARR